MSDNANAATFAIGSADYAVARPTYPAALFDWLAAHAPAQRAAWDVGCGTGQATTALAARFGHVTANDLAAEQVACGPRLPNVSWLVASAENVTLPPASVDLVLVAQALHWFDLDRFYPKVQRALAPGGVFAAIGYSWFSVGAELDAAFKAMVLDPIAPFWAPHNALLWNGYRDIVFPFEPLTVPPFTIEVHWTLPQLQAYLASWSAVKRLSTEAGVDVIGRSQPRLAALWGTGTRRVTMPMCAGIGRMPG